MAANQRRVATLLIPNPGEGFRNVEALINRNAVWELSNLQRIDLPQVFRLNAVGEEIAICIDCEDKEAVLATPPYLFVALGESTSRSCRFLCTTCRDARIQQGGLDSVRGLVYVGDMIRRPWAMCTQEPCLDQNEAFLTAVRAWVAAHPVQEGLNPDELYEVAEANFNGIVRIQTASRARLVRIATARTYANGRFVYMQNAATGTTYTPTALGALMDGGATSCFDCLRMSHPSQFMPLVKWMCTLCFDAGFTVPVATLCCGQSTNLCRLGWNQQIEHGLLAEGLNFNNPSLHPTIAGAHNECMQAVEYHGSLFRRFFLAAMPEIVAAVPAGHPMPKVDFEQLLYRQFYDNLRESPAIDMVISFGNTVVVVEADGDFHDYIPAMQEAQKTAQVIREMILDGKRRICIIHLGILGTMARHVSVEALNCIKEYIIGLVCLAPVPDDAQVELHFKEVGWAEPGAPEKHLKYNKALLGDDSDPAITAEVAELRQSILDAVDHGGHRVFPVGGPIPIAVIQTTRWATALQVP